MSRHVHLVISFSSISNDLHSYGNFCLFIYSCINNHNSTTRMSLFDLYERSLEVLPVLAVSSSLIQNILFALKRNIGNTRRMFLLLLDETCVQEGGHSIAKVN